MSDLQAWIVEGIISRRARSRQGKNLGARTENWVTKIRFWFWCGRAGFSPRYKGEIPERSRSREMRGWERFWHRRSKIKSRTTIYDFGGEIPDLAGRHSNKSAVAVGKEFGMAEGGRGVPDFNKREPGHNLNSTKILITPPKKINMAKWHFI